MKHPLTRRTFLQQSSLSLAGLSLASFPANALESSAPPSPVSIQWLGKQAPTLLPGTTWGVPWPRGQVKRGSGFRLGDVPLQSWPLAYWPDGSLKWTAHAIATTIPAGSIQLTPLTSAPKADAGMATENATSIQIRTGVIDCELAKKGTILIRSIRRNGTVTAENGTLVLQTRTSPDEPDSIRTENFNGEISRISLEQNGPIRSVVKVEGKHAGSKSWLPFVVRLYFYKNSEAVRIIHTIIFDGDEQKDFIQGLGIRLEVPLREAEYNRHVRFVGQNGGVFSEAVKGLTGLRRDPGKEIREAQIAGKSVSNLNDYFKSHLQYIPAFGEYTLYQPTADAFEIQKRTKPGHGWITSALGGRASGTAYLGTPAGGLAFGIRNFWQSYPAQLDVRKAHTDRGEVTLWLWSPKASSMDLRFYHDGMGQDTYAKQLDGLDITYEDYEPGFGTAVGVARTSELQLWALEQTPSNEQLVRIADVIQDPPQLVAESAVIKQAGVFGNCWSMTGSTTPEVQVIEKQLKQYFDYYVKQVDQRSWYGFWNYGDVMHTYDSDRHVWRYDVGGFAWDNSELSTDLWLWYYFLHTGEKDVFRLAEAMTRHTGEVDVHHLGKFSPLGSRHNVLHWGCSAKQLRISTVANRRFYYYLTADERVGDLMREQVEAVRTLREIIPGRKIGQKAPANNEKGELASVSFGTDWGAVAAAWLTEWERTENEQIRTRLLNSMRTIAQQPHGFFTGVSTMELQTGKYQMAPASQISVSHLNSVFGLTEICFELIDLVPDPAFEKAWILYCELYNATPDEQKAVLGQPLSKLNLQQGHSRLTAYAAYRKKDTTLAKRAWKEFYEGEAGYKNPTLKPIQLEGPTVLNPVEEAPVSTNATAQWGLAAMQCLAFAGNPVK